MDDFFDKFGFLIIEVIVAGVIFSMFLFLIIGEDIKNSNFINHLSESVDAEISTDYELTLLNNVSFVVTNGILKQGDNFNWNDYILVYNQKGENLIDYVNVSGEVDTDKLGKYEVIYTLSWNTKIIVKKGIYYVT